MAWFVPYVLLGAVRPAAEEDEHTGATRAHPRDDSHLELVPGGDIAESHRQGWETSDVPSAHVTDIGLECRVIACPSEPHVERSARPVDT